MTQILHEYENLLKRFRSDYELAERLETPNPEDDLHVRIAIVGYSYSQPTETWGRNHYHFLKYYREGDYADENFSTVAANPHLCAAFACLCLGYLLGLFQRGGLSEEQFHVAQRQLVGFIALNGEAFA
jgi:hypothetical protein